MSNRMRIPNVFRSLLNGYWRRKVLVWLGVCPDCGNPLNHMPSGYAHCPTCGRRKP